MTRARDFGLRRARLGAGGIVAVLVAIGVATTLDSSDGSVWRDLGLAVLSGGIVGGALVSVESLLAYAESRRAEHSALLAQMSVTTELSGIDLRGRDLAGLYLPGRALVAARLDAVRLEGAKLYYGDFRHAVLAGADLRDVDLSGSTLSHADLTGADLTGARMRDVDLSRANLRGANLTGADLTGARIRGASMMQTRLDGATFANCYLEGTDFTGASIRSANLDNNQYDATTRWPTEFVPQVSVTVTQPAIADMKLDSYLAWRATDSSRADG